MIRMMSNEEFNSLVKGYKLDSILEPKELKGLIDGIDEAQNKIYALESERDRLAFKIKSLFGFKPGYAPDWGRTEKPYRFFNMATNFKYEPKGWNLFIDLDEVKKSRGKNE